MTLPCFCCAVGEQRFNNEFGFLHSCGKTLRVRMRFELSPVRVTPGWHARRLVTWQSPVAGRKKLETESESVADHHGRPPSRGGVPRAERLLRPVVNNCSRRRREPQDHQKNCAQPLSIMSAVHIFLCILRLLRFWEEHRHACTCRFPKNLKTQNA